MSSLAAARRCCVAIVVMLAVGATTPAVAAVYTRIALQTAYGDAAEASAIGRAPSPQAVYVSTRALPAQAVLTRYAVVCTRGSLVRTRVGSHTTRSFAKRKLTLPMTRADSCTVSASAKIAGAGQVTVRIYRR